MRMRTKRRRAGHGGMPSLRPNPAHTPAMSRSARGLASPTFRNAFCTWFTMASHLRCLGAGADRDRLSSECAATKRHTSGRDPDAALIGPLRGDHRPDTSIRTSGHIAPEDARVGLLHGSPPSGGPAHGMITAVRPDPLRQPISRVARRSRQRPGEGFLRSGSRLLTSTIGTRAPR